MPDPTSPLATNVSDITNGQIPQPANQSLQGMSQLGQLLGLGPRPAGDPVGAALKQQQQTQAMAGMGLNALKNTKEAPIEPEAAPPEKPNEEYRSSLESFKSWGPALAILGSSFTRHPLINAMNAATGAMKGFSEGDKARVDLNMQKWKDSMETWKAEHEKLKDAREAVMKNNEFQFHKAEAYFAAAGHPEWAGNPNLAREAYDKEIKASLEADKTYAEVKKLLSNAATGLDEKTLTKIVIDPNSTPAEKEQAKQQIQELHLLKGGGFGGVEKQMLNDWKQERISSGKTPTEEEEQQKAIEIHGKLANSSSSARALGTQTAKLEFASNLLDSSIPSMMKAMKDVGLSSSTDINKIANTFREHLSDPKYANFRTQVRAVASDYAQFIGRGTGTVHSDEEALKVLNNDMGEGSFEGFAKGITAERQNAQTAIDKTNKEVLGGASGSNSPAVGTIEDGHKFIGGDPSDPKNWTKVSKPLSANES